MATKSTSSLPVVAVSKGKPDEEWDMMENVNDRRRYNRPLQDWEV